MCRRNPSSIIKFAFLASAFLLLFVIFVKLLDSDEKSVDLGERWVNSNKGLPVPPEALPKQQPIEPEKSFPKPRSLNKKDWHDYAKIALDANRTGPGEQGQALILSSEDEAKKDPLYKVNGFNAYASDKIALNRSLPDIRHKGCRDKKYLEDLPTASVVVPFHNEHFSTLLRTAVSVLNRSPEHLIKEVILVDDGSTKEFTKDTLDNYVKKHLPKVKVIHSPKRVGLIRARLLGAKAATGEVLIFLDSHSEANINWLPPLLEPIALDKRTAVCPFIDVIDFETFAYRAQDEGARGAFDWEFFYKRLPLLPEDLKHPTEPFKSPVMAGGLFAIGREFFWEIGGYDDGLEIWGGEQYELSFKIWQCGGQMFDAPCSRVGHIYRKFAPFPNPGIGDFVGRNYRRVAEVWMDEYAEYLYTRRPHYRKIDAGDISQQKAIRQKLDCKPFSWFMKNVAFDLPKHYPPVEPPPYAEGEIRNVESQLCVDTKFKGENERFGLDNCIRDNGQQDGEQQLALTWHKDIRPKKRNVCFDVSSSDIKAPVVLWNCHGQQGNQLWKYNVEKKWLITGHNLRCLDCDAERKELFVSDCSENRPSQKWVFETIDTAHLAKWDEADF